MHCVQSSSAQAVKHQLVVQAADEPRPCGGHSGWEQQRVQATKVGASSVSCETVILRDGLGLGIGEVTKFEKMRALFSVLDLKKIRKYILNREIFKNWCLSPP